MSAASSLTNLYYSWQAKVLNQHFLIQEVQAMNTGSAGYEYRKCRLWILNTLLQPKLVACSLAPRRRPAFRRYQYREAGEGLKIFAIFQLHHAHERKYTRLSLPSFTSSHEATKLCIPPSLHFVSNFLHLINHTPLPLFLNPLPSSPLSHSIIPLSSPTSSTPHNRFSNNKIVRAYSMVLADYRTNSDTINHAVVKMLHRVSVHLKMAPLLYQLSVFRTMQSILHEPTTGRYKVRPLSLPHTTLSYHHLFIPSSPHTITPSHHHSLMPSLPHTITPSYYHPSNHNPSHHSLHHHPSQSSSHKWPHTITPSHHPSLTSSLPHYQPSFTQELEKFAHYIFSVNNFDCTCTTQNCS